MLWGSLPPVTYPSPRRNAAAVFGAVWKAEDALAFGEITDKRPLKDRSVDEADDAAAVPLAALDLARVGCASRELDVRSTVRQRRLNSQGRDGVKTQCERLHGSCGRHSGGCAGLLCN